MAAAAASFSQAAERYAQALFELARDEGRLDAVASDLESIASLMAESPDLRRVVTSPVMTREDQGRALDAVLERGNANPLTRRFIGLVAANRRLFFLPQMIRAFAAQIARHRGEIVAKVTAAHRLSDDQIADLKAQLKAAYGREPRLDIWIDPSLIAGLVVRVGSKMIDGSLKTKLAQLKSVLKEA